MFRRVLNDEVWWGWIARYGHTLHIGLMDRSSSIASQRPCTAVPRYYPPLSLGRWRPTYLRVKHVLDFRSSTTLSVKHQQFLEKRLFLHSLSLDKSIQTFADLGLHIAFRQLYNSLVVYLSNPICSREGYDACMSRTIGWALAVPVKRHSSAV